MTLTARLQPEGLQVILPQPLRTWATQVPEYQLPLAAQLLQDAEAAGIAADQASFLLPNERVAAWSTQVARLAQLPPVLPFPLDLRLSVGLGQPGAQITTRWMKVGTAVALSEAPLLRGLVAEFKGQVFRIAEPLWSVLQLVQTFNARSHEVGAQFECWAAIRRQLGDDLTQSLTDTFLRSLRVIPADAFTLNFAADAAGHPAIVPRLMRKAPDPAGHDAPDTLGMVRGDFALLPEEEDLFARRLDALAEGQTVFPLRDGTFIALTPELARQMVAVRQARRAGPAQRRLMVLNPTGVLRELLGGDAADEVSLDFIETDRYSDRVTQLAAWVPPIVPWVKIPPTDWKGAAGAQAGFRIGEQEVTLTHEEVGQAISTVRAAMAAGHDRVDLGHETVVPATEATLRSLQHLDKALAAATGPAGKPDTSEPPADRENLVLVIETNFEQEDFCRTKVAPRAGRPGLPYSLATPSKPHQETGIQWLQSHWLTGSRGCLLADDMGLGKTYQALAFLAWVKEQMNEGLVPHKPLLVVAPVGLLANWEKEQDLHLRQGGLGAPLRAYGSWLKFLKRGSQTDGTAALDTQELSRASWVLANYEAISEYQLSFGAVNFGAVIFDEAQKIKSPSTAMTTAAKALHVDFVVAMTGTPVENRLADLWCIADTCQPGALKDLKSFSQRFEADPTPQTLQMLRGHLWQQEAAVGREEPLLMLRRLKAEKLKGLPEKHEHVIRQPMPPRQRAAYQQATALSDLRGPQGTLGLIQSLRQISLHPGLFDGQGFDPADSARFAAMLQVLDAVHARGEKALVFIESLEIQTANQLPLLLQRRFRLAQAPLVINGAVGTAERQKRVDAFQANADGFDVMLLSPKAGGVGLTLTAANHVIHLSRWWNPAVEDQCSDRAYRIGQTRDVHIYYPMAIDPDRPEFSFDLKLNELMSRKRELSRSMLMPMEFDKGDYDTLISGIGVKR